MLSPDSNWPIHIEDKQGRHIYLTQERWEHALGHPGMSDSLLKSAIETIRSGQRTQDKFDPNKYKYSQEFHDLPMLYTHFVVVVKFGWKDHPPQANNFVLTAYMIEKW